MNRSLAPIIAPCEVGAGLRVMHGRVSVEWHRIEALKGDRSGGHSIRVNDQYRITFRWESGHAFEVDVEDYH